MSFDSPRRLRYCGRVKRYFDENDPVSYVEGYIYSQEDILSLKTGREDAWPDAVMPGFLRRCDSKFLRYILSSPELTAMANPEQSGVMLFSKERVYRLKLFIILAMILFHFIVPVYVLWFIARRKADGLLYNYRRWSSSHLHKHILCGPIPIRKT